VQSLVGKVYGLGCRVYMTDSATQSASSPVKSYHGIEIISMGRRFDSKRSCFLGSQRRRIFFVRRGNPFLSFFPPGERASLLVEIRRSCDSPRRYPVLHEQTV